MIPYHRRDGHVIRGAVFAIVPYLGLAATVALGHLIDHHPRNVEAKDRLEPHPLRPIGNNHRAQVRVTTSNNELLLPLIHHPGRPPLSRRGYSAIYSLVVFIIASVVFIGGGFFLINRVKVAVRQDYRPQGVLVAVPLGGRSGRRRQVSSVLVQSRAVIARRQKGTFRIQSAMAGREGDFGGWRDCPCKGITAVWNMSLCNVYLWNFIGVWHRTRYGRQRGSGCDSDRGRVIIMRWPTHSFSASIFVVFVSLLL